MTQTPIKLDPPEPLPVALLLAATGGLLDGFVYLNYGHVFANAMTGNVVLLGIAAVSHNWMQVLRHLAPLGAFLVGVVASKLLSLSFGRRAPLIGLSLEIATLFAAGWLPLAFPQMAFTAIIAFVSAYQITSFRHVGKFTYNSTFITGNLREVVEASFDAFDPATRRESLDKALSLGLICLGFLIGAVFGAFLAPHFFNQTLWFAEPFLIVVVAILMTTNDKTPSSSESRNI